MNNLPDYIICIPDYKDESLSYNTEEIIEMRELSRNEKSLLIDKQDTSTTTNDNYRYRTEETTSKILISIDNKIERLLIRVKDIANENNTCFDCLCRCFSCTSFILSLISWFK